MQIFIRRLIGYGFLAAVLAQTASCAPPFYRTLLASLYPISDRGDPPYNGLWQLEAADSAALARFPDLDSCIFAWGPALKWDELPEREVLGSFAWERMETVNDAQVCLFKVFTRLGFEESKLWLNSQGFNVTASLSKTGPVLQGGWLIAARGPLFSNALFGPLWHGFPFPHSISLESIWKPDGSVPIYVRLTENRL